MTLLPIAERELRVVARRVSTYWLRSLASLIALVLLLLFMAGQRNRTISGKDLFVAMSIVAFVFTVFAGVFLTSDALSGEKRAGTLGLLFLTDLKGHDVVLGKLIVSSIHSIYALLAIFPVMGIPLLMGGVTGAEFFRVLGALLVSLGFSLASGLMISAFGQQTRSVALGTFAIIIFFAGICPALYLILGNKFGYHHFHLLAWFSPGCTLSLGFDQNYQFGSFAYQYWNSVYCVCGFSAIFLAIASRHMLTAWKEKTPVVHWWNRLRLVEWIRAAYKSTCKTPALQDGDPIVWLGTRNASTRRLAWVAFALMIPVLIIFLVGGIYGFKNIKLLEWRFFAWFGLISAFGAHQLMKYLVAFESCRQLNEDKSSGALELLLSTPINERQVLSGLRAGLFGQFRRPVGGIALINLSLAAIVNVYAEGLEMRGEDVPMFLLIFGGGGVTFLLDCWALTWLGQWRGLRSRSINRAVTVCLSCIIAMPWAGLAVIIVSQTNSGSSREQDWLGIWILFCIVLAWVLGSYARKNVSRGIRRALNLSD